MSSRVLLISILLLMLTACRQYDDSPLVAQVYDYELRQSDLVGLVPEGVSHDDSVAIVTNYVDQWIRQMVILTKAEKNVTEDFSKQLNEYRNSLITYTYEQQIVNQLLDTSVTADQIAEYYNSHQDEFHLRNSIVKAVYVVAPLKSPATQKLRSIISRNPFQEDDVMDLEEIASYNKLQGYFDSETWIPFYTLQTSVPIITYNENIYLKQNRSIVFHDDSLSYFVRIMDYKVNDDIAPLEVQSENIKAIILNRRKTELQSNLQADLLKKAEKGGHITRNIKAK